MSKWIVAVAAGLLATGTAVADQHMKGGMGGAGERMMEGAGQETGQMERGQQMEQHREQVSFQAMDQDRDGYISHEEARTHTRLQQNWQQADQNGDGRLDEAEFSAWESQ